MSSTFHIDSADLKHISEIVWGSLYVGDTDLIVETIQHMGCELGLDEIRQVWDHIMVPCVMNLCDLQPDLDFEDRPPTIHACVKMLNIQLPRLVAAEVPAEHIRSVAPTMPHGCLTLMLQVVAVVKNFKEFALGVRAYDHSRVWLHMIISDLNSQMDKKAFPIETLEPLNDTTWKLLHIEKYRNMNTLDTKHWFRALGKQSAPFGLVDTLHEAVIKFQDITMGVLAEVFECGGFIAAGGSVLRSLIVPSTSCSSSRAWAGSDVDIFLVLPRERNQTIAERDGVAAAKIEHAVSLIARHLPRLRTTGCVLLLTDTALTMTFKRGPYCEAMKIQFVLCVRDSIPEILNSFDVDCCSVATDGKKFYAPQRAMRALKTGCNILDPVHKCVPKRFAKYYQRRFECMLYIPKPYRRMWRSNVLFCAANEGDAVMYTWKKDGGMTSLVAWRDRTSRDTARPNISKSNGVYISMDSPIQLLDEGMMKVFQAKFATVQKFIALAFQRDVVPTFSTEMSVNVEARMHPRLMGIRLVKEEDLYSR